MAGRKRGVAWRGRGRAQARAWSGRVSSAESACEFVDPGPKDVESSARSQPLLGDLSANVPHPVSVKFRARSRPMLGQLRPSTGRSVALAGRMVDQLESRPAEFGMMSTKDRATSHPDSSGVPPKPGMGQAWAGRARCVDMARAPSAAGA